MKIKLEGNTSIKSPTFDIEVKELGGVLKKLKEALEDQAVFYGSATLMRFQRVDNSPNNLLSDRVHTIHLQGNLKKNELSNHIKPCTKTMQSYAQ